MHVPPATCWRSRAHIALALRARTPTFHSDFTRFMARKTGGPRQPLSQRRPKVAAGKKSAVPRVGRKTTSRPTPKTTAKAKLTPKAKRAPKAARRPAPDALVLYDQLLALYPDAHC